ncbi:hypothetical protein GA0061078_1205 [Bifidobacterium bohemicum]|uniref:Uncharacterized protein n=1 Tax=Bifidobacterium bohemicum DSM 22767 TaxID=1437606 RepID=A0A086ZGA1_9BIFI|nr:hypothetical protein BBOH_1037 [Bifidobacterium bohemicum DSM 22767]SCC02100.1 hypothetical protein GA0061078_1205 [Bifidobacterium bohemicum]
MLTAVVDVSDDGDVRSAGKPNVHTASATEVDVCRSSVNRMGKQRDST